MGNIFVIMAYPKPIALAWTSKGIALTLGGEKTSKESTTTSRMMMWEAGWGALLAAASSLQPTSLTLFIMAMTGYKICKSTTLLAAESSARAVAEAKARGAKDELALRSKLDAVKRQLEEEKRAAVSTLKRAQEVQLAEVSSKLEEEFAKRNAELRRQVDDLKAEGQQLKARRWRWPL